MVSGALLGFALQTMRLPGGANGPLLLKLLGLLTLILGVLVAGVLLMRHLSRQVKLEMAGALDPEKKAGPGDQSAFMMAAIQQAVERSREQEKELDKLRRQEKQRSDEGSQLAALVMKGLDSAVLLLNPRGLITDCNPVAKVLLGHQLLTGRHYREVLWPSYESGQEAPDAMVSLEECMRGGWAAPRKEMSYRTPAGDLRVLSIGLAPLLTAEGSPAGAICQLSDITEITELRQQEAQRDAVTKGLIHDLKNVLTTVSGYAQLIQQSPGEEGRAHAAVIVKESEMLAQALADLANFFRKPVVAAAPVEIRALIESSYGEVIERGGFQGQSLALEGEFPVIQGDADLLHEAFAQLLRHGCQAMPGGGRTRVEAAMEGDGGRPVVRLAFHDAGGGIAPEHLDRLFLPVCDGKRGWSGLGLAVAQKIVAQHSGTIAVESTPEEGTTFVVRLPVG